MRYYMIVRNAKLYIYICIFIYCTCRKIFFLIISHHIFYIPYLILKHHKNIRVYVHALYIIFSYSHILYIAQGLNYKNHGHDVVCLFVPLILLYYYYRHNQYWQKYYSGSGISIISIIMSSSRKNLINRIQKRINFG